MTSKEALENICKTCDNKSCPYIHYEKSRCSFYSIVLKDLKRLEELEEIYNMIQQNKDIVLKRIQSLVETANPLYEVSFELTQKELEKIGGIKNDE